MLSVETYILFISMLELTLLNSCIYRHGAPTGALAGSKLDGTSQQNNIVSRIQSKTDVDYATQPNERRERHAVVDKDRTTIKGNK